MKGSDRRENEQKLKEVRCGRKKESEDNKKEARTRGSNEKGGNEKGK